jgi:hypothetical protein
VHCVSWGHKKAIVNCHMNNYRLSMLFLDKYRSHLPLIRRESEDHRLYFVPIRIGNEGAYLERAPYAIAATLLPCPPGVFRVVVVWKDEGFLPAHKLRTTGKERYPNAQNAPRPTRWTGYASRWPAGTSIIRKPPGMRLHTIIETGSGTYLYTRQPGWGPDPFISFLPSSLPLSGRDIMLKTPYSVHAIQP